MAVTFQIQKKKQKYLVYLLIIIILVAIFTLWFSFFKKPQGIPQATPPKTWPKIEINFEILKNPLFENFKEFEKIPSFEGTVGRQNPFVPYSK